MKRIIPAFLVLIVVFTAASCGTQDQEGATPRPDQSPPAQSPAPTGSSSPVPITLDKQYVNERFGFSLRYPDAWKAAESQNGDGVRFDTGVSGQRIRAYGANYMAEYSNPFERAGQEGYTLTEIMLDDGARASVIQGQAGSHYIYEMVAVHGEVEYHIVYELTQDYYDDHRSLIEAVTASFAYTES